MINTGSGTGLAGSKDISVASTCISDTQGRICIGGTLSNSNHCITKTLQHNTSFNLVLRQTPFDDPTASDTENCIQLNNIPVAYDTTPRKQYTASCVQQQVVS